MYLFFCFCSIHLLYCAVNKTCYRRTNVRPQKISQRRRWERIIVTCNLSHRTSEAVSDYYRRSEVLSSWLGVLFVAFMGKIREKTRLTSLHCSQGYRHSVEQNVDSLWYRVCWSWVCSLTSIVLQYSSLEPFWFTYIVDLTFRITTCRFLLAILSLSWDLVCINLSFASRDFVCPRMTSIRIAFGVVHRRGYHAFRESSCVSLAHGPRWLFLLSRHRKAFLLLLIRCLL